MDRIDLGELLFGDARGGEIAFENLGRRA